MPYNALYYPYIDPPNRATLATAMLYWDRLYTIVPASMGEPYRLPASRIAADLGFLRARSVTSDCEQVGKASEEFLNDYGRKVIAKDMRSAQRIGNEQVRLHVEKMTQGLVDAIVRHRRVDRLGFHEVASKIAAPYMSRLATIVAESDGTTLLTDRTLSQNAALDRYVEGLRSKVAQRHEAILAMLSLRTIRMPPSTSLADLWAFREEHYGELVAYRRAIRNLARQAGVVEDVDELESRFQQIVRDEVRPAEERVTVKLQEAKFDAGLCFTEAGAVGAVALAASGGRLLPGLAAAGVRLVFSVCRWRIAEDRLRREPFAYLCHARQRFQFEED